MKLHNLEKVSNYKVQDWLKKSIPELTEYQKQRIRDDEIVRFAPFEFYKRRKKVDNFFLRLTILFIPIVWLLLVVSLPFNFIITGRWGYDYDKLNWFTKWMNSCGL